ncbi:hypothetical protein II898_03325 [bacterium]|nr:hypothetical protein [bacterium]
MKLPSKIFSPEESTISYFPIILKCLDKKIEKSVCELYQETIKAFPSNVDWMDTILCLYAIGAINFDEEKGVIIYAL